ncbi:hypothetical protein VNI00_011087 [Paramarasmius palmivorus]|uniref:Flavin-containing monooxygenase n=1 Tax=Paramarasmius palmivorus TaxID=297713 RepID=A0AAW0CC64_9AGAR
MEASESWTFRIPTLDRLQASLPEPLDAAQIAKDWFHAFTERIHDADATLQLLCPDALWRDLLAFTWDMRTFVGQDKIRPFLKDRVAGSSFDRSEMTSFVQLQKPFPDLAWIVAIFRFEVEAGGCCGVFRLVPTASGAWKAFTIFTSLDNLRGFPYEVGALRRSNVVPGIRWSQHRREEVDCRDSDPVVLIVGAGQSALSLAARLKYLKVHTLMIEKDARVGDSWRRRYDSLCLHFPMADWLENYVNTLELNVWTSTTVLDAAQAQDNTWNIRVQRSDNSIRNLRVRHLVMATGVGDNVPNIPEIPGSGIYKGQVMHSIYYKSPQEFIGKRVTVIGAGNSAHDICSDLAREGIDVTMFQRGSTFVMNMDKHWKFLGGALYREDGPPTHIADCLSQSMPHLLQAGGIAQRATKAILKSQSDTVEKLKERGFRVGSGVKEAGVLLQIKERGGGHCFDTGSCQLIIDGKIKVKSDSQIRSFYEEGIEFDNGSRLESDIVIYATGTGDMRQSIRQICGDKVADECPPLIGVNDEGEMNWYRQLSRIGLWYMVGPFALNRFYSNFLALQIKAMEENVMGARYSMDL